MNINLSRIIRESIDDLIYDDIISEAIDNVVLLVERGGKGNRGGKGKKNRNGSNNNLANVRKMHNRNNASAGNANASAGNANAPANNTNANTNNEVNQTAQQLFEKYNFKQYSDQLRNLIGNGIDPKPVADDQNSVQFINAFNQFLYAVITAIENNNITRIPGFNGGKGGYGTYQNPYEESPFRTAIQAPGNVIGAAANAAETAVSAVPGLNQLYGGVFGAFNKGREEQERLNNQIRTNYIRYQNTKNGSEGIGNTANVQGNSLSELMLGNNSTYASMNAYYQNANGTNNGKLNSIAVIPQCFEVLRQLYNALAQYQEEMQKLAQQTQQVQQQNGGNQGEEGQQGENDGKPRPDYSQYVQKINDGLNKLKGYEGKIRSLKSDLANTLSEAVADLSKNVITAINNGVYYTEDNKDGNTLPLTLLMSLDGKDDPTQNTYNAVAQIYINLKGEFENNPKSGNKVKTCFGGITSILTNLRNQMTADKVTENGGASGVKPGEASTGEESGGAPGGKPTGVITPSVEEPSVGTKLEIKPFGGYGSKEEEVEAKNNNYNTMVDETYNKFGMTPIDAFDVYGNQVFESELSKKGEALKYDSQSMEDENASGELLGLGKSYEAMHRLAVEMTHKGQVADAGLKEQWGNSLNEIYENISNSYYDTENEKVENESKNMMGTYNYLRKLYADINDGVYSENTDPRRQVKDQITEKYQQTISEDYKYCEEILAEDKKFGFFKKHLSEDAIDIIDNLRDTLGYIKDALDTGVFNMMDSDLQSKTFNSPLQISSVLCLGRGKDDADKQWIEFWNSWQTAINWPESKKDKEVLESLENIYETLNELRNDLVANDLCDEWYKKY